MGQGRPPETVPAAALAGDAALRHYATAAIRRAEAQAEAARARYHAASNRDAAIRASEDSAWWYHQGIAIRTAADRIVAGNDLLIASDALLEGDTEAAKTIAAERAFSRSTAPEQLEVSLAGSFSFWVAVGLLSAWAIRRGDTEDDGTDDAGMGTEAGGEAPAT
jgi:hypothetical protein